jgi:hypothetical protein
LLPTKEVELFRVGEPVPGSATVKKTRQNIQRLTQPEDLHEAAKMYALPYVISKASVSSFNKIRVWYKKDQRAYQL